MPGAAFHFSGAAMNSSRAFHDTYYVVVHTPIVLVSVALTALMLALWISPNGLLAQKAGRWRQAVLLAFLMGFLLSLLPAILVALNFPHTFADAVWVFAWANRLAVLGAALMVLATLATLGLFVAISLCRLRR